MTVKTRKDADTPRVFMHKVADVRGGVSVAASELGGAFLREGAVLSAPVGGICHVVKVATAAAEAGATEKAIKVQKHHNLKPGDFVTTALGTAAAKVTAIDESAKAYDTITLDKAVGAVALGGFIVETKDATGAALKYEPQSICGTGKAVDPKSNINTDAWVIGVTKGNALPADIAKKLPGIINL